MSKNTPHRSLRLVIGMFLCLGLVTGCSAGPVARRGPVQVAQLPRSPTPAPLPDDAGGPPRVADRAYARFGQGVMKRLQSDRIRMIVNGQAPADEQERTLAPAQLSTRADGLWKEAVDAFKEVLKLDPRSARAAEQLGQGYLDRGKVQDGLRYLNLSSDLDPGDFEREYRLGLILERADDHASAIRHLELASRARSSPNKERLLPVVMLKLAGLLEQSGKGEEAVGAYQAFLDLPVGTEDMYGGNPVLQRLMSNRGPVYQQLGKLLVSLGKTGEAIEVYRRGLERDPGLKVIHLLMAKAHLAAGDSDAAVTQARTFIEADPDNPEGYQFLINLYEQQGRLAEAMETTEELLKRQPEQYRMRFLLGGMYERNRQPEQAIRCYRHIVSERRVYVPVYIHLGELYHERGEDAQALWVYSEGMMAGITDESLFEALDDLIGSVKDGKALVEQMRAALPEAERSFAFYYVMGQVSQKSEDEAGAIDAYEHVLKLNPRFPYGYIRLAAIYVAVGRTDDAIALLESALGSQVRNVVIFRFLGQLAQEKGRLEQARSAFESALQVAPWDYPTCIELVRVYLGLKEPQKAEELLRRGMEANPTDVGRWGYALGFFYVNQSDEENLDKGIELLETCLATQPDDPACLRTLTLAYVRRQDYQKAVETAGRLVNVNPQDPAGYYFQAAVEEDSGDLAAAEATLRVALGKFNKDAESSLQLGRFLIRWRRSTREGVLLLERAVAMQPDQPEPLMTLAWALEKLKEYPKAETALLKARKLAPDNARLVYSLAALYQSMGRHEDAQKELRALLIKDSDDPVASNALGYFFAENSRNLDEAETLIRKALTKEPENGAYLDSLGWVYYKQGKLEQALTLLEEAWEKEQDGVISEHVGDVLYRLGRKEEARAAWEAAVKLDPYLDSSSRRVERLDKGLDPLEEPVTK